MTNLLTDFSNALAQVVATVGNSVVKVDARRRLPASGIVWSADGLILTAHHVVKGDKAEIGLADGKSVPAKLVGRDPGTDVALLQAETTGLAPAGWSEAAQVGNFVLALGRPGKSVQATFGVVSAVGGEWRTPAGGKVDRYLQTDVLMYPGFSGGPLVAADGQVLGLNSSALLSGVSVAIPAGNIRRTIESLLTHGHIKRGYLGVSTQTARLPQAIAEQAGQETGLLVVAVEPGSPAETSGLTLGDTILNLDGVVVRHHDDLLATLNGERVGNKVPMGLLRGGELRTLNVTIGQRQ